MDESSYSSTNLSNIDWFCDVTLDTLTSVYGVFYYDIVNMFYIIVVQPL
jgi:hypothetical protein